MKKSGVLNCEISKVLAEMGHQDMLTICDAGLPIPQQSHRIDLAIHPGLPGFIDVVKVIAEELIVEKIIVAEEMEVVKQGHKHELKKIFPDIEMVAVSHEEFKKISCSSRAFVRTGECTPYANVILVSGVSF